jgi:uncharacterized protein YdhG (YjbR/CyaY superfamily)
MASRPVTIAQYIAAAPRAGQTHLRALYRILKKAAPKATEAIKWGTPFFIEPRFVFAFSAHKAHLSLVVPAAVMAAYREKLRDHQTTKHFLKIPYDEPLPETLIRAMARDSVRAVAKREGDSFW